MALVPPFPQNGHPLAGWYNSQGGGWEGWGDEWDGEWGEWHGQDKWAGWDDDAADAESSGKPAASTKDDSAEQGAVADGAARPLRVHYQPDSNFTAARALIEKLDEEEMLKLGEELMFGYSHQNFQDELQRINRDRDPHHPKYREKLGSLLRTWHDWALSRFNISMPPEQTDILLALNASLLSVKGFIEGNALTDLLDTTLFGPTPEVANPSCLTKREVVNILRQQIVGFIAPSFQERVRLRMQKRMTLSPAQVAALTEVPGQLPKDVATMALCRQGPIMAKYGLEPNERGLLSLMTQLTKYIMDPIVATCVSTANFLLGMDGPSNKRFMERLEAICFEDLPQLRGNPDAD